jgi:photosystem II stability/assembly factor-like uncharacterized protein
MFYPSIVRAGLFVALGAVSGAGSARDSADVSPLKRPALQTPQAHRAAMTGVARAGARLVAVGERGVILVSEDQGGSWRQVPVPVSVTLTAVKFVDDRHGWATGHAGTVLATADGGSTWNVQLDGMHAAALALAAARAGRARQDLAVAQQWVDDGADKPFLDLHVVDANTVVVVGAYGLCFVTHDAGRTWASALDRIDNPEGRHLNAIGGHGSHIVVVGEQGLVLRSTDGGGRFGRVQTPVRTTWFAVDVTPRGAILLGGLRGHMLLSDATGVEWTRVRMPTDATVTTLLRDGRRLLAGDQKGALFESADGGASFLPIDLRSTGPLVSMTLARDGQPVVADLQGVRRLTTKRREP